MSLFLSGPLHHTHLLRALQISHYQFPVVCCEHLSLLGQYYHGGGDPGEEEKGGREEGVGKDYLLMSPENCGV